MTSVHHVTDIPSEAGIACDAFPTFHPLRAWKYGRKINGSDKTGAPAMYEPWRTDYCPPRVERRVPAKAELEARARVEGREETMRGFHATDHERQTGRTFQRRMMDFPDGTTTLALFCYAAPRGQEDKRTVEGRPGCTTLGCAWIRCDWPKTADSRAARLTAKPFFRPGRAKRYSTFCLCCTSENDRSSSALCTAPSRLQDLPLGTIAAAANDNRSTRWPSA